MGKNWMKEELKQASKAMIASGQMGYEKFYEMLAGGVFEIESSEQTDEETEKEVRS